MPTCQNHIVALTNKEYQQHGRSQACTITGDVHHQLKPMPNQSLGHWVLQYCNRQNINVMGLQLTQVGILQNKNPIIGFTSNKNGGRIGMRPTQDVRIYCMYIYIHMNIMYIYIHQPTDLDRFICLPCVFKWDCHGCITGISINKTSVPKS